MDEFAPHTNIRWSGNVGTVEYGGDNRMVAIFYNEARHNPAKSTEAGSPVYDDVVMVRIHPPGERLNIVVRPATVQDKRRFPVQWAQFQENRIQIPEGTPIDLLYPDKVAIAATLRAHGVHTIEQCAELSADAIENIGMGAQKYVNDSAKYLEMANKGVGANQLRKELEERDQEISTLKRTVDMLKAQIDELRENNTAQIDLQQLQRLIAGQAARPTFPGLKQLDAGFDAQTALINGTSARAEKPKRSRERIKR
ncbi:MAG TPA: hypothetical protein VFR24_27390 [Candidatus Angelobacter sp.]|nr:hypothetical protein [Candidatus Angelobacter sp.]